MKKSICLIVPVLLLVCSCNKQGSTKEYFKSWNSFSSLTALKEYVEDVTKVNFAF